VSGCRSICNATPEATALPSSETVPGERLESVACILMSASIITWIASSSGEPRSMPSSAPSGRMSTRSGPRTIFCGGGVPSFVRK
jgi:hypothetical protein